MKKKYEINRTKIKGSCQSGRKVVTHNSKSDLPLAVCLLNSSHNNVSFDKWRLKKKVKSNERTRHRFSPLSRYLSNQPKRRIEPRSKLCSITSFTALLSMLRFLDIKIGSI